MKKPLISVIVPAYNVDKYLEDTMDSILTQTYESLDIILVDDGSTDNTPTICDSYQKIDKRVRVFHQKNGGLSAARISGLKKAKGRYITFVDGDDTIEKDYVEYLYKLIKKHQTDMSTCPYKTSINSYDEKITTTQALKKLLLNDGIPISLWGKMYKKELLKDIDFKLGFLYEDNGITYRIISKCDYIACGNIAKYNYVIRDNSITTSKWNPKKLDLITLTDEMCDFIDNSFPELKDCTTKRRMESRLATLRQAVFSEYTDSQEIDEIIKYVKTHETWILKNPYSATRDKTAIYALRLGKRFYKNSWGFYSKMRRGV